MKCYGIIPARYESSRFPGKPLAEILGKPMFWHVYQRAALCKALESVYLATDDRRIMEAANHFQIPAVMTRSDHPSGTDRVFEAATALQLPEDSIVANIQGDEPAISPDMIRELLTPFQDGGEEVHVTTLARKITEEQARSSDVVKVVFRPDGQALYFSRAGIPFPRGKSQGVYYGHVGMYAFRLPALRAFVSMPPSKLETIEKLEQLRLMENGIPIHVAFTDRNSHGVDRREDIAVVETMIDRNDIT